MKLHIPFLVICVHLYIRQHQTNFLYSRFHNYISDQNDNHIAEEKTRRMKYEILRVTPRENLTKNYMEWISSSASHKSSILEFKLSLIFISILISIMVSWRGCQKSQLWQVTFYIVWHQPASKSSICCSSLNDYVQKY